MTATNDLGRIIVSALGALIASGLCLVGVAGPARAAPPAATQVVVTTHAATGLVGALRY